MPDMERKELHDLTYMWNLRVDYIEAESRNVITGGREMGEMGGESGEMLVKEYRVEVKSINKSRDLMYNMMTIVNIAVWYMRKSFKE